MHEKVCQVGLWQEFLIRWTVKRIYNFYCKSEAVIIQ